MIVFDTPLVWENGLESIIFGQTVVFLSLPGAPSCVCVCDGQIEQFVCERAYPSRHTVD